MLDCKDVGMSFVVGWCRVKVDKSKAAIKTVVNFWSSKLLDFVFIPSLFEHQPVICGNVANCTF